MKLKKTGFFVGLLMCLFFMCFSVKAADEGYYYEPEREPFVISNIKTNKTQIKEEEYFEYSFVITPRKNEMQKLIQERMGADAAETRIDGIYLKWSNWKMKAMETYNYYAYYGKLIKWDGKQKCKVSGKIKVMKGAVADKFKLDEIRLAYSYQNPGKKHRTSYNEYFSYDNKRNKNKSKKLRSKLTFKTIIQKEDHDAPQCDVDSLAISTNVVNGSQKAILSVKVTDESRIKSVVSEWRMIGKKSKSGIITSIPMKYNRATGRYECKVGVSKKYIKAKFVDIVTTDVHENFGGLSCAEKDRKKYDLVRK